MQKLSGKVDIFDQSCDSCLQKNVPKLSPSTKAHHLTKRLDIPGCIQVVTQRLTKYPILLENIIKNTKNDG